MTTSRMNTYKQIILAYVLLVFSICTITAAPDTQQEAKLHTTMSAKSFFVGEEFLYEILISPAEKVTVEEMEGDDALAIKFIKQEQVKRDGISTVVLRYKLIPLTAGTVMIPPTTIEVGNQALSTNEEAYIEVKQAETYPGMEVQRSLPDRDFYIGEPFTVDYTWKSPLPLNGFRAVKLNLPMFYDHAFKVRNPHDWIAGDDKAAIGFPVANTRVIGRYGYVTEGKENFHTVSFPKIILPVKAGEFTLSPAMILTSYVAPVGKIGKRQGWQTNYPSYFNNNFFLDTEGKVFKKYYAASESHKFRVLPLPDAGKPHDFAGQVGACEIHVTAAPTVLREGDPITLTIEIDGYPFPEVLELPDLGKQAAFTRRFAMPPRQSSGRIKDGKKTYIRTLRPLAQDATAIPSVRIPYFDPETKSYGVAESAPIPITVQAAEMVTAFDATMSGAGPLRNHVEKNKEGIRANFSSGEAMRSQKLTGFHWFLFLLVIPPCGFLTFYAATAKQRLMKKDPVKARAQGAMKRFSQQMSRLSGTTQDLGELDNIVRTYFADKLNLVRHAHTFEELEEVVGGRANTEPLRKIYAYCEGQKYRAGDEAPTEGDVTAMIRQAQQSIETINQALS